MWNRFPRIAVEYLTLARALSGFSQVRFANIDNHMTRLVLALLFWCALWFVVPVALGQDNGLIEYGKVDAFVSRPLGISMVERVSLTNLRKVGVVQQERVAVVPNRHNPKQQDETRTLQFDGLVIEAYFPARDQTDGLVGEVNVTKPNWKLRYGLNVGVSAKVVESVLGKPDERKPDILRYCSDVVCAAFVLAGNRVVKVTVQGRID